MTNNPAPHNPIEESNTLRTVLIVIIFLVAGGFLYHWAGLRFPSGLGFGKAMKESEAQTILDEKNTDPLKDTDLVFRRGFMDTGLPWPPKEEDWSEELKQNPMCALRASYCQKVGYQFADFGCDCFVYQYYHSFETYKNIEEGITLYYPKLWHLAAHRPLEIIAEQKLSLERDGATCYLSYGRVDGAVILKTMDPVSSSFVTADGKQLQQMSVGFSRALTDEEKAAGYTDKKLIAIPHFPYQNSEFGLLLTSFENQPLAEACEKELEEIVRSVTIEYPPVKLTKDSVGEIFIHDVPVWYKSSEDAPNLNANLLFEDHKTKRKMSLGSGSLSNLTRMENPFVAGDLLYYMDQGRVKVFDVFGSTVETIPLAYTEDFPVHSFFVEGDWMYYLSGKFCNEYMAQCNLSLYRFNLATKQTEDLADGLSTREIVGFNSAKNVLYSSYTMADAGCTARTYEAYNLNSKRVTKVGEYSHCIEDIEKPDPYAGLVADVVTVDTVVVKNGGLSMPSPKMNEKGSLIKMNLSENVKSSIDL